MSAVIMYHMHLNKKFYFNVKSFEGSGYWVHYVERNKAKRFASTEEAQAMMKRLNDQKTEWQIEAA